MAASAAAPRLAFRESRRLAPRIRRRSRPLVASLSTHDGGGDRGDLSRSRTLNPEP